MEKIDRTTWRYWLYGDGHWTARWESTSHDPVLFFIVLAAVVWMATEYIRYVFLVGKSRAIWNDSLYRLHLDGLMGVLAISVAIHLLNVGIWFCTPYYVWAALFVVNAMRAHRMNTRFEAAMSSKQIADTIAEHRLKQVMQYMAKVSAEPESNEVLSIREHAQRTLDIAQGNPPKRQR